MKTDALMKLDGLDLRDPKVKKEVRELIQAQAMIEFPRGLKRILEILDSENEGRAMAAARLLAEIGGLTGATKHEVEVKMTFEDLRQRSSEGGLSRLFEIAEPIEAQIEDE